MPWLVGRSQRAPFSLVVQSFALPHRRANRMHTSSFCGDIDVTAMETNATRAAGAVVAGAIVTNVLLPFRRASTEDRKQMLQREDLSGLRALCNALRVKSGVSKAG